jgi:hypothetical protein
VCSGAYIASARRSAGERAPEVFQLHVFVGRCGEDIFVDETLSRERAGEAEDGVGDRFAGRRGTGKRSA